MDDITLGLHIYGSQTMNPNDFGEQLTSCTTTYICGSEYNVAATFGQIGMKFRSDVHNLHRMNGAFHLATPADQSYIYPDYDYAKLIKYP